MASERNGWGGFVFSGFEMLVCNTCTFNSFWYHFCHHTHLLRKDMSADDLSFLSLWEHSSWKLLQLCQYHSLILRNHKYIVIQIIVANAVGDTTWASRSLFAIYWSFLIHCEPYALKLIASSEIPTCQFASSLVEKCCAPRRHSLGSTLECCTGCGKQLSPTANCTNYTSLCCLLLVRSSPPRVCLS